MSVEWTRGPFSISTDRARMDVRVIHEYLTQSYWAEGIDEQTVRRSIEGSLCFGVFHEQRQVGFARVISDRATFAYVADMFILDEFRGRGLSKWMMEAVTAHPELQDLRRWLLATRDAHPLYRKFEFAELSAPERFMERFDPNVYRRPWAMRSVG